MKKLIIALLMFSPTLFLSSCTVTRTAYHPGYTNDYVYSVGYYGYRPYWGSRYAGYGWRSGYWSGYRGVYSVGYPRAWYGYVRRW
ncbi:MULTISPECIES: hypothetical protein [unclassified Legionella]|uniref:hypothetical protein n=1 Tax=unclassified Legionella TaxID=2622702 RepID=UPI001055B45D|nr:MULTISPECIES: hypothetical protein [unclassified Legionella]MDI9819357.1 hypothetical protein [Legionella sp. PL877]